MENLRLLTVVQNLALGGTQRAAQNYSLGFARAGLPVAVLAWEAGGPREAALTDAGIPVFIGRDGVEEAIRWGADIVHAHRWGDTEPVTGRLLERLVAGPSRPKVLETNVFGRVDRSPARFAIDVHLQLSEWCLWRWHRWARGLTPAPLGVVVPYAVEPDPFAPLSSEARAAWRRSHGIPEDAVLYGRIGQPSQWKWHPSLLTAFGDVAANDPKAWLLVVGLPAELRSVLESLSKSVQHRIVDIPFLAGDGSLREAYGSLDVFVHAATIGESFGMVLAESMLCETPVVTLSRPIRDNSQLEVVGHGIGGLVAATGRDLAQAMRRLGESPELRKDLGRGGRKRVMSRFTTSVVTEQLLELIQEVASARSREELRERLSAHPSMITRVSGERIQELLARMEGHAPVLDRLLMHGLHHPATLALWKRLKQQRRSATSEFS